MEGISHHGRLLQEEPGGQPVIIRRSEGAEEEVRKQASQPGLVRRVGWSRFHCRDVHEERIERGAGRVEGRDT